MHTYNYNYPLQDITLIRLNVLRKPKKTSFSGFIQIGQSYQRGNFKCYSNCLVKIRVIFEVVLDQKNNQN